MSIASTAKLKQFLDIIGSANDTLLSNVLVGVNARIERYCGRKFEEATYTAERYDANGKSDALMLNHWPITTLTSVSIENVGVTIATEIIEDKPAGVIYRRSATDSFAPAVWDAGRRNIKVTYDAGYANVPEDVREAAIKQAAYEWRNSRPGGNRIGDRGTVLDAGGSASYLVGAWAPGVRESLEPWRNRRFA